jgi:hypothetical protein
MGLKRRKTTIRIEVKSPLQLGRPRECQCLPRCADVKESRALPSRMAELVRGPVTSHVGEIAAFSIKRRGVAERWWRDWDPPACRFVCLRRRRRHRGVRLGMEESCSRALKEKYAC